MSIIRQTAAARSLIFCDWGNQRADLELMRELKATHLTIGLNQIKEAEQHHRFEVYGSLTGQRGDAYASGLHDLGAAPCLHVWMVASESFVREAARACAEAARRWRISVIIPNVELPWWGTTNPKLLASRPLKEQQRLKEAASADHGTLGALFVSELRRRGFEGQVWTCTFFWMPVATHALARASDGIVAQMMSFSNARKPVSTTSLLWPSRRQINAWDRLQPWRQTSNQRWLLFGQQAVYHQEAYAKQLGTDDLTLPVRMAAHTYLGGAAAHSEANLAWWSWYWLRQYGWARKLVASYSPRSTNPVGWYVSFNGAPP